MGDLSLQARLITQSDEYDTRPSKISTRNKVGLLKGRSDCTL